MKECMLLVVVMCLGIMLCTPLFTWLVNRSGQLKKCREKVSEWLKSVALYLLIGWLTSIAVMMVDIETHYIAAGIGLAVVLSVILAIAGEK